MRHQFLPACPPVQIVQYHSSNVFELNALTTISAADVSGRVVW